jgi:hypothetical protein
MDPAAFDDVSFPDSNRLKADQAEARDLVKAYQALYGDEVVDASIAVPWKGQQVPLQDVLGIAQLSAVDQETGAPYQRPAKPPTAGTETERAAALRGQLRAAMAAGDAAKAEALQGQLNDLTETRRLFGESGRAPVDPAIADMNKTLKELQIDAARARLQGGGETQELTNEIKRLQIAQQRDKIDAGQQADTTKRTAALQLADDMTDVIDDLLDPATGQLTPGASAIVGGRIPFASQVPASKAADAKAALDRLTGTLVIELMAEMKAQSRTGATGFGQLSERELAVLLQAATKLSNRNMSEGAFAAELKRIRDKMGLVYQNDQPSRKPKNTTDGPTVGERRTINGQVGEWDGQGWKAVN